ncbi:uncharacterized protein LOC110858883 isoform X2 [Folsomia candida]|uniref:Putative pectinesterase/pectinesterase inhibitor 45 n=1 Tax=Folsomia candida TaxID=158441 RepID=A0A226DED1_FOLCA|nr:uncharacterized protein LOC110858883 isoform X2 [Folsomia candida]OXA43067.1 putative pectinesterase/pectinesterase inhibitor 45 [Folsomia candida]
MDNIKRFVNTSEDLQLLLSNHSVSGPGRLEILLKRGLYDKITIHQSNLTLTGENKSDTIVSGIVIKRNVSKIQLENLSVALDATVTVDEGCGIILENIYFFGVSPPSPKRNINIPILQITGDDNVIKNITFGHVEKLAVSTWGNRNVFQDIFFEGAGTAVRNSGNWAMLKNLVCENFTRAGIMTSGHFVTIQNCVMTCKDVPKIMLKEEQEDPVKKVDMNPTGFYCDGYSNEVDVVDCNFDGVDLRRQSRVSLKNVACGEILLLKSGGHTVTNCQGKILYDLVEQTEFRNCRFQEIFKGTSNTVEDRVATAKADDRFKLPSSTFEDMTTKNSEPREITKKT